MTNFTDFIKENYPDDVPEQKPSPSVDEIGNPLEDMNHEPIKVNGDGSIDIYHAALPSSKAEILRTGKWKSNEQGYVFFSNFTRGGRGFGNSAVHIRILPRYVRLTDAFRNGEIYVSAKIRDLERFGKIING